MTRAFRLEGRTRLFDWRAAVVEAELQPTTKLVALVLSIHMNRAGESCFPGTKLLMRQTSLGRSAVLEHVRSLIDLGWLRSDQEAGRGGPRAYTACFPAGVVAQIVAEVTAEPSAQVDGSPGANGRTVQEPSRNRPPRRTGLSLEDGEVGEDVKPPRSRAVVETWLTPYVDDWKRAFGSDPNGGQLAKTLRPVHEERGLDYVRPRWRLYLALTPAAYVNPERFRATIGAPQWDPAVSDAERMRALGRPARPTAVSGKDYLR